MKPTVDLTADRMFPDKGKRKLPEWMGINSELDTLNFLFSNHISRMPFELNDDIREIDSLSELSGYMWSPLPIGSAKEFRYDIEIYKADSTQWCDKCGKRIRTPWRYDYTLCDDCSIELEKQMYAHKVPWEDTDHFWSTINTKLNFLEG